MEVAGKSHGRNFYRVDIKSKGSVRLFVLEGRKMRKIKFRALIYPLFSFALLISAVKAHAYEIKGVDYALNSASVLLVLYGFSIREFDSASNASSSRLACGIKQNITKQFYFDARAGIDFIDSYADKKYAKPLLLLLFSLVDEISQKNTLRFEFSREYDKSPYI
jgi:hypothetical protein